MSQPKIVGDGTVAPAQPAAEALVVEHQRVDRERGGERHHRQVHAAQPQRRQADQQPERHRDQRGEQQRERERRARADGEVAERRTPRQPRERHLRERHLADVAGQHDERQRQADAHQRRDERRAQRAVQQHQHDTPTTKHSAVVRVRPRRAPERRVARLADGPARADAAREQRHRDHDQRRTAAPAGAPCSGSQSQTVEQLGDLRLQHPEREAGDRRDRERRGSARPARRRAPGR